MERDAPAYWLQTVVMAGAAPRREGATYLAEWVLQMATLGQNVRREIVTWLMLNEPYRFFSWYCRETNSTKYCFPYDTVNAEVFGMQHKVENSVGEVKRHYSLGRGTPRHVWDSLHLNAGGDQ